MEGNRRTKRGSIDPPFAQKRKGKETKWIKTLHTAYPCEMKDKVGDKITTNIGKLKIGSKF